MKNSPFLSCGRLEQRHRQCLRLGAAAQLFRGSPIGAPRVERIEDDVAAVLVVKALDELAGRVIDDGGIAAASESVEGSAA